MGTSWQYWFGQNWVTPSSRSGSDGFTICPAIWTNTSNGTPPKSRPSPALQHGLHCLATNGDQILLPGLSAGASTKRRPNLAPGPKNTAIPVDALVRVRVLQKLTTHRTKVYIKKIVNHFPPPHFYVYSFLITLDWKFHLITAKVPCAGLVTANGNAVAEKCTFSVKSE